MIETYLDESIEDNLVESIFEEVSEETWEAIEEAILAELSPTTLRNYQSKAIRSRDRAQKDARSNAVRYGKLKQKPGETDAEHAVRMDNNYKHPSDLPGIKKDADDAKKKVANREAGLARSYASLMKKKK